MWKPNLNRHFAKILPALKISTFLILWNGLFHSLTLSILIYWSSTSSRVPDMNRMTTLNQFLTENQILFATLCSVGGALFFRDQFLSLFVEWRAGLRSFGINFARGALFAVSMMGALILNHRYEFLGFSAQASLNFLSSYAWLFRALLLLLFVVSSELVIRVVLRREWDDEKWNLTGYGLETITHLIIYWIWFTPTFRELGALTLLFLLFQGFWSASGFISALFITTHAIFGLPFFENEFTGVIQLKPVLETTRAEETFLQNSYVWATLLVLVIALRGSKLLMLKSNLLESKKERKRKFHE